jgi:DNA-binding LacI/PurR family transcriptional regulator
MKRGTSDADAPKSTPPAVRAHHSGAWVEERLRQDILDGKILVGTKLFSSMQLAAYYGIDKMTANRAVQRLAREGLLRSQRGSGTFLNVPPPTSTAGLLYYGPRQVGRPYAPVLRELRLYLQKHGCSCSMLSRDDEGDLPGDTAFGPSLGQVTAGKFDLHIGVGIMNRKYFERLCWLDAPVLAVDYAPGLDRVSSVSADSFNAGYCAAELLLQHGHKRLLFVPLFRGSPRIGTLHRELDSYLHECGWRYRLETVADGASCQYLGALEKNAEARKQRLADVFAGPNRPTAVFGTGNLVVEIETLLELGLKVPDDVSVVVSMWDESDARTQGRELTRYTVAWREMAREAVRIVEDLVSRRKGGAQHVLVNAHFHEGGTVRSIRGDAR